MEITKVVKKYGDSWVVQLSKDDRKLLGITEIGQVVNVKQFKKEEPIPDDLDEY